MVSFLTDDSLFEALSQPLTSVPLPARLTIFFDCTISNTNKSLVTRQFHFSLSPATAQEPSRSSTSIRPVASWSQPAGTEAGRATPPKSYWDTKSAFPSNSGVSHTHCTLLLLYIWCELYYDTGRFLSGPGCTASFSSLLSTRWTIPDVASVAFLPTCITVTLTIAFTLV